MFTGFTAETIDFLWGIRMNNNRDWFSQHKQQYTQTLYEPMKALGADLYRLFDGRTGDLLKVSRIYRDARLHHPDPYKESLWICIRRDMEWWAENPCLFFEINPDGVAYGFSLWRPTTAAMENFRRAIAADPAAFFDLLSSAKAAVGCPVTAQSYKRSRNAAPVPELQPYFDWKADIGCIQSEPVGEQLFGPALGGRVGDFLSGMLPLYDYFNTICSGTVGRP